MVNQRRYKRGKKTNRRKTKRVKRSRVKRSRVKGSRVKRTKMRGGGMGETVPEQPTTFHEPDQLHEFSMTGLIPEGERVVPEGSAGPGFSNREIKYLQNRNRKRKRKKNKKNNLIEKKSNIKIE